METSDLKKIKKKIQGLYEKNKEEFQFLQKIQGDSKEKKNFQEWFQEKINSVCQLDKQNEEKVSKYKKKKETFLLKLANELNVAVSMVFSNHFDRMELNVFDSVQYLLDEDLKEEDFVRKIKEICWLKDPKEEYEAYFRTVDNLELHQEAILGAMRLQVSAALSEKLVSMVPSLPNKGIRVEAVTSQDKTNREDLVMKIQKQLRETQGTSNLVLKANKNFVQSLDMAKEITEQLVKEEKCGQIEKIELRFSWLGDEYKKTLGEFSKQEGLQGKFALTIGKSICPRLLPHRKQSKMLGEDEDVKGKRKALKHSKKRYQYVVMEEQNTKS